jgi:flagellar basal body-associated protein FliL
MELTQIVYVVLVLVALMVIAYWVFATRRLKTRPHVGTQEGIAMAIQAKERSGKNGSVV